MDLGCLKSHIISTSLSWSWMSWPKWRGPWGLLLFWGAGSNSSLNLLIPVVWLRSFSRMARKDVSTQNEGPKLEQRLMADRMDSRWDSVIPQRTKFSSWRVAATCSRRTWRISGLKSIMVTPLRSRPLSWCMFGLWDRWGKSDSVSCQLVTARWAKGVLGHLGRKQAIRSENSGWQLS